MGRKKNVWTFQTTNKQTFTLEYLDMATKKVDWVGKVIHWEMC